MNKAWLGISVLLLISSGTFAQNVPSGSVSPEINLRRTVTVDVVQRTKDAVVYISTTKIVHTSPFGADPFFRQLIPQFQTQAVPVQSLGSGFIVHEDGYVVTNNHVIDRAREITVELPDGRKLPAEVVSADPEVDLAILKITSDKPFPRLELGDSSDLMIGEPVIAVGNPLGYSHSVSTGIVSAVHRDLGDEGAKLNDLIQTDAAINPGNSGGPLLNAYGQVIGINSAIRSDAQNIGFAIPIDKLRDIVPELMDPAHMNKVDLPIKLKEQRTLTPPANVACTVRLADNSGAKVTSINGHAVRDLIDAYAQLLKVKADESVKLEFDKGTSKTYLAKAVAPPDALVQAKKKLGLDVEWVTPMLAQKDGLDADSGLLINQVQSGSVAARAGLRRGDVIVGLGQYPQVQSLEDFGTLLQHLPRSGRVPVNVVRGAQQGYLLLKFTPAIQS